VVVVTGGRVVAVDTESGEGYTVGRIICGGEVLCSDIGAFSFTTVADCRPTGAVLIVVTGERVTSVDTETLVLKVVGRIMGGGEVLRSEFCTLSRAMADCWPIGDVTLLIGPGVISVDIETVVVKLVRRIIGGGEELRIDIAACSKGSTVTVVRLTIVSTVVTITVLVPV
jgi:hypothetical protein